MATFVVLNSFTNGKEIIYDLDAAIVMPSRNPGNKHGSLIIPGNGAGPSQDVWQTFDDIAKAIGAKRIAPPDSALNVK